MGADVLDDRMVRQDEGHTPQPPRAPDRQVRAAPMERRGHSRFEHALDHGCLPGLSSLFGQFSLSGLSGGVISYPVSMRIDEIDGIDQIEQTTSH
jgi:hypothetical protein